MSLVAISIILSILVSIIVAVNVTNRRMLANDRTSVPVTSPVQFISPEFLQCPVNFDALVQKLKSNQNRRLETQLNLDLNTVGATRANALMTIDILDEGEENVIEYNYNTSKVMLLERFITEIDNNYMISLYAHKLRAARKSARMFEARINKASKHTA